MFLGESWYLVKNNTQEKMSFKNEESNLRPLDSTL